MVPQIVTAVREASNRKKSEALSPDPSDPKLAHLDELNLSRPWMLEGIATSLANGDNRLPMIRAATEEHKSAGLAAVTGKHYEGGHWLGSFAVYLVIATRHSTRVSRSIMQFSGLRREIHSASLLPSVA
jgi:Protein of unknown function (DUF2891)